MQQAEYNHEDFANTVEADKSLMVRFFYKNVENKLESQKQGRPVFKEKIYIEIRVPGQRDVQACRPATHADKMRFPLHLEAFEKRMEPPTEGMPLSEWPKITRTQAEEFSFLNVKTVEQLASMKDSNVQKFMNGHALRDQAIKWLENNDAETEDREKTELKQEVATLKEQVRQLLEANNASEAGKGDIVSVDLSSSLDSTDTQVQVAEESEIPPNENVGSLTSEAEPKVEGAAVPVAAAPAAKKKRASRKRRA